MNSILWEFDNGAKLVYPGDHKVGMRVPKGGSNCAKCEYVRNDNQDCAQENFIAWNHGPKLPLPADVYCCDFFEIK